MHRYPRELDNVGNCSLLLVTLKKDDKTETG